MITQPLATSPKDDPMHIDKTRFKPLIEQEKQRRHTNLIYVCIVENQVMLLVNVQRSVDHMQHALTQLLIHN
jgi:hypothetical protein